MAGLVRFRAPVSEVWVEGRLGVKVGSRCFKNAV